MKPQITLEAFRDWAAKQPPDERYDYIDCFHCAFCRYLKFLGFPTPYVDGIHFEFKYGDHLEGKHRRLPEGIDDAVYGGGEAQDWTFGALAKRLS